MKTALFFLLVFFTASILSAQTGGGSGAGSSGGAAGGTAGGTATVGTTTRSGSAATSATVHGGRVANPANPSLPGTPVTLQGSGVNSRLPGSPVPRSLPFGVAPSVPAIYGGATNSQLTTVNPALGGVTNTPLITATNAPLLSLTNALGNNFSFANPSGGTISAPQLQGTLVNLQVQLQQALPVIAAFNEHFSLTAQQVAANTSLTASATNVTAQASRGSPPVVSGSLAQTTSGSTPGLTANRGQQPISGSLEQTTSGSGPTLTQGNLNQGANLSPTGVTNAFGLAPGFSATGNTNGTANTASLDTIRSMVVLQSDMERLLPVLAALNGTVTSAGTVSAIPSGQTATVPLTNGFAPKNTSSGAYRTLTPTGR